MNKITYRRVSIFALFIAVILFAAACGANEDAGGGPADEQEVSIIRIGSWSTGGIDSHEDPHRKVGGIGTTENMYEALAYPYLDTLEIRPVLAESWEVSNGGETYTFTLQEGVRFHDGSTLDSEDVKLSFERMVALQEGLGSAELGSIIVEILTPDERTVVFNLTSGGPPFLALQTGVLIVSSEAVQEHQTDDDPWATEYIAVNSAGSGPYQLAEIRAKEILRMTRFDDYWRGWEEGQVDEIEIIEVPEESTQALMLENGELDIAPRVPIESIEAFRDNPDVTVLEKRGAASFYLRMNTHGGPLADINLRKAFAHAFDYESFTIARSDYFPPDGPMPSQSLDGWRPPNLPEFDLDLARDYYAEAGYGPDNPLRIEQFVVSGNEDQRVAAEILQQGLAELGVEYVILPGEFSPIYSGLLRYVREGDESGYIDMFTLRMPAIYPDLSAYVSPYYSNQDLNMMGYTNPEVDALIDMAAPNVTSDFGERVELYKEALTMIVDDQPDIWVGVERYESVMRSTVQGYHMHPLWFPEVLVYPIRLEEE